MNPHLQMNKLSFFFLAVVTCPNATIDLILVLDSSGSISSGNYEKQLNFSCKLISAFTIGPNNVRVGGVLFSTTTEKLFDLETYDTNSSICRVWYSLNVCLIYQFVYMSIDWSVCEHLSSYRYSSDKSIEYTWDIQQN